MGAKISRMGDQTTHVMNNMEITGSAFMQIEKKLSDLRTALDKGKHPSLSGISADS